MKKIDILDLEVSCLEQKYNINYIIVFKIEYLHVQYVHVLVWNRTCTCTIVRLIVRTRLSVPDTSLESFMIPWKKCAPSFLPLGKLT